jgi:hypothetical protein
MLKLNSLCAALLVIGLGASLLPECRMSRITSPKVSKNPPTKTVLIGSIFSGVSIKDTVIKMPNAQNDHCCVVGGYQNALQ